MSDLFWREFAHHALPRVPVAVALLAGLVVLIARRRRLGAATYWAITGFAVLAFGSVAELGWLAWVLDTATNREVDDMRLAYDLQPTMAIALPMISITGLLLVTGAVFIGRTAKPVAA